MVYRRTDREMTAYPHEYEFVKGEGVRVRFLTQPVRVIVDNGSVSGLECIRMNLGEPDASGRAAPQPIPGSEFTLPADQIVRAIGQKANSRVALRTRHQQRLHPGRRIV